MGVSDLNSGGSAFNPGAFRRAAIFIDLENMQYWLKTGFNKTMAELESQWHLQIRQVYGNWSNQSLAAFQRPLHEWGFELMQTYHPVSGKNSADIQLSVDIISLALTQPQISTFVIVSGDSDFSPVFRELHRLGKDLIGVGPDSHLKRCVEKLCLTYLVTENPNDLLLQPPVQQKKPPYYKPAVFKKPTLSLSAARELVLSQIKGNPVVLIGDLKGELLRVDPNFSQTYWGFKLFKDFINSIPGLETFYSHNATVCQVRFTKAATPTVAESAHLQDRILQAYQSACAKWGETVSIIQLKSHLLSLDPSFSPEKHGYKGIKDVVLYLGLFKISKKTTNWKLSLKSESSLLALPALPEKSTEKSPETLYESVYRLEKWLPIERDQLIEVQGLLISAEPMTVSELEDYLDHEQVYQYDHSPEKALQPFFKSQLMLLVEDHFMAEDCRYQILQQADFLCQIDLAILKSFVLGLVKQNLEPDLELIKSYLYESYTADSLESLCEDARREITMSQTLLQDDADAGDCQ